LGEVQDQRAALVKIQVVVLILLVVNLGDVVDGVAVLIKDVRDDVHFSM
jgi:cyanate permease